MIRDRVSEKPPAVDGWINLGKSSALAGATASDTKNATAIVAFRLIICVPGLS